MGLKPVGAEFKDAMQALLLDIAKEALKLHTTFEGRKITSADDVAAFRQDICQLEDNVRTLDSDARRCQRYYLDGGLG